MLTIENVAAICHAANHELCLGQGDGSQLPWHEAPHWAKQSAIDGVEFHLNNPEATPSASHENWLAHKEADGWRYGVMKNAITKEHPCMVPYDELPAEQQLKDYLFMAIVKAAKPFLKPPDGIV